MNSHTHLPSVFIFLFTLLFFTTSYSQTQEENVRPGINNSYYDADFEQWVNTFESPGREVYDKKNIILQTLQIQPGMKIADIGAGTGLYTIPLAQQVGTTGLVYAVDISENFVKNVNLRAEKKGLHNVLGHVNSQTEIGLPKNSIDLAFICNTYHHFEYPITTLKSIYQSLGSEGKLVIIDYKREPKISSSWVMGHVRADTDKVIKEVESVGFKLVNKHNVLKKNYFLSFKK